MINQSDNLNEINALHFQLTFSCFSFFVCSRIFLFFASGLFQMCPVCVCFLWTWKIPLINVWYPKCLGFCCFVFCFFGVKVVTRKQNQTEKKYFNSGGKYVDGEFLIIFILFVVFSVWKPKKWIPNLFKCHVVVLLFSGFVVNIFCLNIHKYLNINTNKWMNEWMNSKNKATNPKEK